MRFHCQLGYYECLRIGNTRNCIARAILASRNASKLAASGIAFPVQSWLPEMLQNWQRAELLFQCNLGFQKCFKIGSERNCFSRAILVPRNASKLPASVIAFPVQSWPPEMLQNCQRAELLFQSNLDFQKSFKIGSERRCEDHTSVLP